MSDRLAFVKPPFDLANVAASADASEANLIVLDYIQRISPPGEHGDKRGSVDATMSHLRQFADTGVAVVVVSRVSRGKDTKGRSSYAADSLLLASFAESSELEFGADDAFILVSDEKDADRITLRHLKARHSEAKNVVLTFDKRCQRFTEVEDPNAWQPEQHRGKLQAAIAMAWDPVNPADHEGGESWQ